MYELKSYKKPLIKGYQPIPLETEVSPVGETEVITEATRLFDNTDCWHITINEYAKDAQNELRGTPHWCADAEQVQVWLEGNR
jgi:hypothetical protein